MYVAICLAGKGKVKIKGRTPKGGGEQTEPNPVGVPNIGGRGMGGSAPATPTEAETCNQSTTGWSRNSLRGSKCNFFFSFLVDLNSLNSPKQPKLQKTTGISRQKLAHLRVDVTSNSSAIRDYQHSLIFVVGKPDS